MRQMKRDIIGSKTMVSELQNLAAGVNVTEIQQILHNAQDPSKMKYIRKPMSPIYGSLYASPKTL